MAVQPEERTRGAGAHEASVLDALAVAASLLFANGQTTERTIQDIERLAAAFGVTARVSASWDGLAIELAGKDRVVAVTPAGVDMGKVAALVAVIDQARDGSLSLADTGIALERIRTMSSVSTLRFSLMAGAGAAALGVIFGAVHTLSLVLIGLSGFLGGGLRRAIGRLSHNALVQPFAAALLAGAIGALTVRLQLSDLQRLIAVCPCMVLVPGPHLLNGAIDLMRARIPLGLARLAYASLIILAISTGLLIGLALGGTTLPPAAPGRFAPLLSDTIAAGVAVAAYSSFFSMPWRLLPVPVVIGMAAHAVHWAAVVAAGLSPEMAALLSCLLVGTLMTPIADRLRLPFAALAFASVVSLIPGVFLFRMAGGLVELVQGGDAADPRLVAVVIADAGQAFLIMLTMTVGLIVPKMAIEWLIAKARGQAA
jgi:uncharacterized membrane protein YjjP (DUF1212 family)